jgi:hypothetical protein
LEARLGAALKASVAVPEARSAAVRREALSTTNGAAAAAFPAGAEEAVEEPDAVANGVVTPPMDNPDETNVWPTAAEEAAFLSDARGRGEVVVPVARETVEEAEDNAKALPKLDELVEQIPTETRELLDELFRARFVAVRRVKKADLKK